MRNGRGSLAILYLLVGLRLIQFLQGCWQGVRHTTLDCSQSLLGKNERYHLGLGTLLVQLASTVEIVLPSLVGLLTTQFKHTLASHQSQCRLVEEGQITAQQCLDGVQGLSEVPAAFQGNNIIQLA